jgi:ATP-binding protein involved in chromosome partitioning
LDHSGPTGISIYSRSAVNNVKTFRPDISPTVSPEAIKEHLKQVKYPGFSRDIVSFGLVRSAAWIDGTVKVSLLLATHDPKTALAVETAVVGVPPRDPGVKDIILDVAVQPVRSPSAPAPGANQAGTAAAPRSIRHSIAIGSGKGGVGKSTFSQSRLRPGPSPDRAGSSGPGRTHGLRHLRAQRPPDDGSARATGTRWRGPCAAGSPRGEGHEHGVPSGRQHSGRLARTHDHEEHPQFGVQNVRWGELDVLLIDLPPGTGDAQLSLVQTLPLDGAVIVTTPQPASTHVARKGGLMFQKVNVPLLGVAENMSWYEDASGTRQALFGAGGGAKTADSLGTTLLGQVPLVSDIRAGGDAGSPWWSARPSAPASVTFREIAEDLLDRVAERPRRRCRRRIDSRPQSGHARGACRMVPVPSRTFPGSRCPDLPPEPSGIVPARTSSTPRSGGGKKP